MTIVSSTAIVGHTQSDGRRYVREQHSDHLGVVHEVEYLAQFDQTDEGLASTLSGRVAQLEEALAASEYANRVNFDGWQEPLQHQTASQFADRLRLEYRFSARERVCYLAWWLLRRINEGTFTDAQVRSAFGMTTLQYTTFKTNKLIPMHDHWVAVRDAQGE